MAGGLHIEMTAFKVIGNWLKKNWLDENGWTTAIFNAGIATSSVADSRLKATHVTRTRHTHQITAVSLSIMQHDAYERYKDTLLVGENVLDFTDWCGKMRAEQPQFKYWSVELEMELSDHRINQGMTLSELSRITFNVHSMGIQLRPYQLR